MPSGSGMITSLGFLEILSLFILHMGFNNKLAELDGSHVSVLLMVASPPSVRGHVPAAREERHSLWNRSLGPKPLFSPSSRCAAHTVCVGTPALA